MKPRVSDRVRWKLGAHTGEGVILGRRESYWRVSLDALWGERGMPEEFNEYAKAQGFMAIMDHEVEEILERPFPFTLDEALEWLR